MSIAIFHDCSIGGGGGGRLLYAMMCNLFYIYILLYYIGPRTIYIIFLYCPPPLGYISIISVNA